MSENIFQRKYNRTNVLQYKVLYTFICVRIFFKIVLNICIVFCKFHLLISAHEMKYENGHQDR